MKPIYCYVFHYNSYTKQWAAIDRDYYTDYLNGTISYEHVTYADTISTLLTLFPDGPTQDESKEESKS